MDRSISCRHRRQSFLASFIIRLLDGVVVPVLGFGQGQIQIEPLPAHFESLRTGAPFQRQNLAKNLTFCRSKLCILV